MTIFLITQCHIKIAEKYFDTFNQSVFDHILDQFYSSTYQTFSTAKTKGHFSSLENKIENLKSEKLYT